MEEEKRNDHASNVLLSLEGEEKKGEKERRERNEERGRSWYESLSL